MSGNATMYRLLHCFPALFKQSSPSKKVFWKDVKWLGSIILTRTTCGIVEVGFVEGPRASLLQFLCFWHGHNVALPPKVKSEELIVNSECCKIPKSNTEFWVEKIRRNKERDKEEQRKLAAMGWHCITVWECELKPSKRVATLDSIAFTLNHIWLQDHSVRKSYEPTEEETSLPMVAEE